MIKADEQYKPKEDLEVLCLTSWFAPVTGGHEIILPAGVIFKIAHDPAPGSTAVGCELIEYDKWEKVFIPIDEREAPKYAGYYLVIDYNSIDNKCEKIN